jgi:hypothetical protein
MLAWLSHPVSRACLLACILLQGALLNVSAVLDANSFTNTSPPADGSPWANVGQVPAGPSGIYLANGWVLTAAHVGAQDIYFGGTQYHYDGQSYQLTNTPSGSPADMVLFHLSTVPNLQPLALASTSPTLNSQVDMIGFGHNAGAPTNTAGLTGFTWSASGVKSWGNNKISQSNVEVYDGVGTNISFVTDFDSLGLGQTSDEGQATVGDSGGAVFQHTSSGWQLAGMMYAIDGPSNQPPNTSMYGDQTFSADIATYRSQILSLINTTPPVLTINRSGTNMMVCWANTGLSHTLQAVTNLAATNWTTVPQAQVPTNGQICVTVPATNSARFFRLHP